MSNCIACGNPFQLDVNGTIQVQAKHESLGEYTFPFPSLKTEHGLEVPYFTIDELQKIVEHFKKTCDENMLKVLVKGRTMDFQLFSQYVTHHDTVQLIISGTFTVHLQPIIQVENESVFGYEALLRPSLNGTPVSPKHLFEVAELTELQSLLDQKAREAAVIAKSLNLSDDDHLFINFLPSTIYNPEFCLQHTFAVIDQYKVNPNSLIFEVVETEEIDDMHHLKSILSTYKKNGMRVALDDVGAGFATLERLELLNPDIVKIDRQYIRDCHLIQEKQLFLQEVMQVARKLDIDVLAEGIETAEEYQYCKKIGVDFVQGYYFGKPQPNPLPKGYVRL